MLDEGELFGIYPEGTRSHDGRLYRGKTGVARLALETGVPVIPVAVVGTDVVAPPGKKFGTFTRPMVRFGKPLDFSRYEGLENDRYILRSITDEIMYEIMRLSGQEYVDLYAARAKEESKRRLEQGHRAPAGQPSRPDRASRRRRPEPHGRPGSGPAASRGRGPDASRALAVLRVRRAAQRGRARPLPRPTTSRTRAAAVACVVAMVGLDRLRDLGLRRRPPAARRCCSWPTSPSPWRCSLLSPVRQGRRRCSATLPGFWVMGALLAWAIHWRWVGGLVAGARASRRPTSRCAPS